MPYKYRRYSIVIPLTTAQKLHSSLNKPFKSWNKTLLDIADMLQEMNKEGDNTPQ